MARYVYGLTLPDIRQELGLTELLLGLIASVTFAGYLAGLVLAGPLAARRGSRAPTTVGGVCGALGAVIVVAAQSPWLLAVGAVLCGSAGGWVWAPYSDIVTRTVTSRDQPRALAMITTGTGVGLIALGGLAALAVQGSWRLVWAAVAGAAVVAAVMNLRLVPRTDPVGRPRGQGGLGDLARALPAPAGYSIVYFAVVILYFTYAADALGRTDLPAFAVPVAYVLIGACGLTALATGALAQRWGSTRVAAMCLATVGAALALLGPAGDSLVIAVASACVFGVGYMTGSAVLAVWTAEAGLRTRGSGVHRVPGGGGCELRGRAGTRRRRLTIVGPRCGAAGRRCAVGDRRSGARRVRPTPGAHLRSRLLSWDREWPGRGREGQPGPPVLAPGGPSSAATGFSRACLCPRRTPSS